MSEDQQPESWVGQGSTPQQSADPREVAAAQAHLLRTRSRTLAGMHDMLLESHRLIMDDGKQYAKDGRSYLTDLKAVGHVAAELVENGGKILKTFQGFAEEMRKPVQPRATNAEVAVDGFKHLASEIRVLLERTLAGHPDLQQEIAKHFSRLVQRGGEVLGQSASPPNATAAGPAEPADNRASIATEAETLEALRTLGQSWVNEYMQAQGITKFEQVKPTHYQVIREAAKAKKRETVT